MLPYNRTTLVGKELEYIKDAVLTGVISGEGTYGRKCEEFLEQHLGPQSTAFMMPSCTDGLEMCALLLDIQAGDEVILPSFTFVTTASAFALRGAKLVFADVDPVTLNIAASEVERLINQNTKAVVAVHYAGHPCDMDGLQEICSKYSVPLVEDAAQALGATYKGKPLGSFGTFSTFSFHETKSVTCGEGGTLIVNDQAYVEQAHIIRNKGTNRKKFQRGEVPFYTWVGLGSSFVISDVLAAYLYAQLEHLDKIIKQRCELCIRYLEQLSSLAKEGHLTLPPFDQEQSSAHIFSILLPSKIQRDRLQKYLQEKGITAIFHYQPLHNSPYVEKTQGKQQRLPVTESVAERILRLPLYYSLGFREVDMVSDAIKEFFSTTK